MAEQLKVIIDADVQKAVQGFKVFEGSINILNKQLERLQKIASLPNLSFSQQERLNNLIAKTTSDLNKMKLGAERVNPAFAKLQSVSNSATGSLINLGRVVQDAPFGFLGIANNLNPLLESFQRLKAETGSTGKALTALKSSLLGAGGIGFALSVVSSLLIVFGDKIFGAGKKATESAREIKSSFDVIGDATDSVQGDIAKVNALVKAATDTGNSLKVQTNAINELKKISKDYFGQLSVGKSSFDEITKAANAYTQSLVQQAIVKGLQEEITELSKQIRTATKEYADLTKKTNESRVSLQKTINENATNVQGMAATNRAVGVATNSYNKLQGKLSGAANEVGKLTSQFKGLISELQNQVGISLELKTPIVETVKESIKEAQAFLDSSSGLLEFKATLDLSFVDDLKKTRDELFKNANIFGDNTKIIKGIVPGVGDDVAKRNKAFFDQFQQDIQASADLIGGVLTPAFTGMFDAIIAGENPLRAFFQSLIKGVNQLINRLIAAAIQAAILSALSGGTTTFGGAFSKLLGFGGVAGGGGFGLGNQIGSRSFGNVLNVVVTGQVSGQNILLSGQRAAGSNRRTG